MPRGTVEVKDEVEDNKPSHHVPLWPLCIPFSYSLPHCYACGRSLYALPVERGSMITCKQYGAPKVTSVFTCKQANKTTHLSGLKQTRQTLSKNIKSLEVRRH